MFNFVQLFYFRTVPVFISVHFRGQNNFRSNVLVKRRGRGARIDVDQEGSSSVRSTCFDLINVERIRRGRASSRCRDKIELGHDIERENDLTLRMFIQTVELRNQ